MTAPASHLAPAVRQTSLQARVPERPTRMRVSLAFVEDRVNVWLRFGKPTAEIVLDRWRRVTMFVPGTVCCRVKWIGNVSGTALWQLLVMQAPTPFEGAQRVAGVLPGARVLLRSDGEAQVEAVLAVIDAIEALGIDPCTVAASYWRKVGHRLGAGLPLPVYTAERHAARGAPGAWRQGMTQPAVPLPVLLAGMATAVALLVGPVLVPREPLFVYNPSASVAPGWYRIERMGRGDSLRVGSTVLVRLPADVAALAAQRGYLPNGVPILKRVGALAPQSVCVSEQAVRIDGAVVAGVRLQDGMYRLLQAWGQCRALVKGEVFLLSDTHPASFDSRYFGPVQVSAVLGIAHPLWIWSAP